MGREKARPFLLKSIFRSSAINCVERVVYKNSRALALSRGKALEIRDYAMKLVERIPMYTTIACIAQVAVHRESAMLLINVDGLYVTMVDKKVVKRGMVGGEEGPRRIQRCLYTANGHLFLFFEDDLVMGCDVVEGSIENAREYIPYGHRILSACIDPSSGEDVLVLLLTASGENRVLRRVALLGDFEEELQVSLPADAYKVLVSRDLQIVLCEKEVLVMQNKEIVGRTNFGNRRVRDICEVRENEFIASMFANEVCRVRISEDPSGAKYHLSIFGYQKTPDLIEKMFMIEHGVVLCHNKRGEASLYEVGDSFRKLAQISRAREFRNLRAGADPNRKALLFASNTSRGSEITEVRLLIKGKAKQRYTLKHEHTRVWAFGQLLLVRYIAETEAYWLSETLELMEVLPWIEDCCYTGENCLTAIAKDGRILRYDVSPAKRTMTLAGQRDCRASDAELSSTALARKPGDEIIEAHIDASGVLLVTKDRVAYLDGLSGELRAELDTAQLRVAHVFLGAEPCEAVVTTYEGCIFLIRGAPGTISKIKEGASQKIVPLTADTYVSNDFRGRLRLMSIRLHRGGGKSRRGVALDLEPSIIIGTSGTKGGRILNAANYSLYIERILQNTFKVSKIHRGASKQVLYKSARECVLVGDLHVEVRRMKMKERCVLRRRRWAKEVLSFLDLRNHLAVVFVAARTGELGWRDVQEIELTLFKKGKALKESCVLGYKDVVVQGLDGVDPSSFVLTVNVLEAESEAAIRGKMILLRIESSVLHEKFVLETPSSIQSVSVQGPLVACATEQKVVLYRVAGDALVEVHRTFSCYTPFRIKMRGNRILSGGIPSASLFLVDDNAVDEIGRYHEDSFYCAAEVVGGGRYFCSDNEGNFKILGEGPDGEMVHEASMGIREVVSDAVAAALDILGGEAAVYFSTSSGSLNLLAGLEAVAQHLPFLFDVQRAAAEELSFFDYAEITSYKTRNFSASSEGVLDYGLVCRFGELRSGKEIAERHRVSAARVRGILKYLDSLH